MTLRISMIMCSHIVKRKHEEAYQETDIFITKEIYVKLKLKLKLKN